jgi:antirestriction protein ArdC
LAHDLSGGFGSKTYTREEPVAEMASAFVCASLGITPTVRHTDYPKSGSWMIARWRRIGGNYRDGDRDDESGGSPGG